MEIQCYRAIKEPKPTHLRIGCSDPRFRIAFRDFTLKELGLEQGEFVPISIGGGPAALAHPKKIGSQFSFLMSQITFFLGHFKSIKHIVLISHEDCGFYKKIENHPDEKNQEKNDLPRAIENLEILLSHITVEAYYAQFADESHTEIFFEKVA